MSSPTLRIFLARHGETDWNAERRMQGALDAPLNAKGHAQARELAGKLDGVTLDRIYTSSLTRSIETARPLDGRAPTEALPDLDEQALGSFEGARIGDDPELRGTMKRRRADPDDDLDGGESARMHLARVGAAVDSILERHESGTILLVGHGGTNMMVLARLFGLTFERARRLRQGNAEVYVIDLRPGSPPALGRWGGPGGLESIDPDLVRPGVELDDSRCRATCSTASDGREASF